MTVVNLLALFAEHVERHQAASTYAWYRGFLNSFIRSIPATLQVRELKPFHVTRWLDRNPRWGMSTRRGAITAVKRAIQWGVDEGFVDRSPLAKVRR